MSSKTASILSVTLSILLFLLLAVLALLFEMVALNGAGERQGATALSISLICHGAGAILLGVVAWKLTDFTITRLHLKPVLAVGITVLLGTLAGSLVSFLVVVLTIPMAGIR